jgi:hypothetical protein
MRDDTSECGLGHARKATCLDGGAGPGPEDGAALKADESQAGGKSV